MKNILKNNLFLESLFRDSTVLIFFGVASGIVGFIATALTSNIYSPEIFGIYAIFISIVSTLGPISNMCLEYGIMGLEKRKMHSYLSSILVVPILFSTVVFCILYLFLWLNLIPINYVVALNMPLIVMIYVLSGGVSRIFHAQIFQLSLVKYSAFTKFFESLTHHGLFIIFGILGFSYIGMQAASIIGFWVGIIMIYAVLKSKKFPFFTKPSLGVIINNVYENRVLIYKKTPAIFIHNLNIVLPIIMISNLSSSSEVGFLALALRLARIPYLMLSSLSQIYLKKFMEIKSDYSLFKFYFSNWLVLIFLGLLSTSALFAIPNSVFYIAFNKSWVQSFVFLKLVYTWIIMEFIAFILSGIYQRLGYLGTSLLFELVSLCIFVFVILSYSQKDSLSLVDLLSVINLVLTFIYIVITVLPLLILYFRKYNGK